MTTQQPPVPVSAATIIIGRERLQKMKHCRRQLVDEKIGILEFLKAESLGLAIDRLTLFAHWITPEMMPKRFDTRFYLAEAPEDHLGVHDGQESVDSLWITPRQALSENEAGEKTILFPTRMDIEKLGRSSSLSEAIDTARNSDIITVQPWVENRDSGPCLCIPEAADYGLTAAPLEKIISARP